MIIEIINDYQRLSASVDVIIKSSGYKIGYLQKQMGMDNVSFYNKRKHAKFTPGELKKLFEIIDIERLEDKILEEISIECEQSETLDAAATKEALGWK